MNSEPNRRSMVPQIAGGFILIFIIMGGAILYSLSVLAQVGEDLRDIAEEELPLIAIVTELTLLQLEQAILLERIVGVMAATDNEISVISPFQVTPLEAEFEQHTNDILQVLADADRLILEIRGITANEDVLAELDVLVIDLTELADHHDDYIRAANQIFALFDLGDQAGAMALVDGVRQSEDAIDLETETLLRSLEQFVSNDARRAELSEAAGYRTALILGAVGGVGVIALGLVVTGRVRRSEQSENERHQAMIGRDRLAGILNATADGIITMDELGTVESYNLGTERIFGYTADEVIGQNIKMLMPSPYHEEHDGYLSRYHRTGEAHILNQEREVEGRRKDGASFPLAIRVRELTGADRKLYIGTVQDITERKQEQQARATSEARLEGILNATADGIITMDELGTVESYNLGTERIFGYTADEVIGQNIKMLMPSPYHEEHDGYLSRYHRTGEAHILNQEREVEGRRKDGASFPLAIRVRELTGADRKLYIGTVQDITERKQDQQQREAVITTVREVSSQLSTTSAEMLAAMTQQLTSAQEQAVAVAETSTTVNEVMQTTQRSAERAKEVSESSVKARQVTEDGRAVVMESVEKMQAVQEQSQAVTDNIVALADRAQAIAEIIATVNEIADQTNLLALNAAIEASRAGEHGRGFSVVAGEVKALADQSKTATAQVRKILGEIQQATRDTVSSTERVGVTVTGTVAVVTRAGDAIANLAKIIEDAAQSALQISASSNQQLTGISQVSEAMADIDKSVTQSNAASGQTQQSATGLTTLAEQLSDLLRGYGEAS